MLLGTDINLCSSWDTISIQVNPLPVLNINNNLSTICEGESISLIMSGANSYVWTPSYGLNTSIGTSVIASPNTSTLYTISGTDTNGCSENISSNIIVNSSPSLSLDPSSSVICKGDSINIEVFGANSYSWSPSIGLSSINTNVVTAYPQTSVTYKIVGIDDNFCKDSINFVLDVQLPPQISVSPISPVICEGESITLTAEGSNDYLWSPSLNLSSSIGSSVVSSANISTTYQVIGSDSENCRDTITFDLSVIPVPTEIVSGGGSICSGDSAALLVDVTGNPPWDISYSIDGAVSVITSYNDPTIIYSVLEGTYTIPYIIDANSCSNVGVGSEFIDVLNRPQLVLIIIPKIFNMLDPEIRFVNNSIFSNTYLWSFGDNTPNSTEFEPVHLYQEDNIYPIMLMAQKWSCIDTAFTVVNINSYYSLYKS